MYRCLRHMVLGPGMVLLLRELGLFQIGEKYVRLLQGTKGP